VRMSLRVLTVVVTGILLALGGEQAIAGTNPPERPGLVTIDAATSTSLTLSWPAVAGATGYVVERGDYPDMSHRVVVGRTAESHLTVDGLRPGAIACFQVRGVNRAGVGKGSHRACQRTVGTEGDSTGPVYRVLTYNICTRACPGWESRRADAAALVAAQRPDVVMLTESSPESGMAEAVGGMTQVVTKSGKALLYDTDEFRVVSSDGAPRTGWIDLGMRHYAVWAELVDRSSEQHVLFVGVHLSQGGSLEKDQRRRQQALTMMSDLERLNPQGLPVVIAGDFNSYWQRQYDTSGDVMRAAGLADSFWRAHKWVNGNYDSGNRGQAVPKIGWTWGRHLDQVWADPARTQVLKWGNAAALQDGRYVPLPSNHNPVMVRLRVNW
jgi:endonuclease/exonuclease/phosphatase family metal-dependent hydrolase